MARLSAAWPGGGGGVTGERQGFTGVEGLGTTDLKTLRGHLEVNAERRPARHVHAPLVRWHHRHHALTDGVVGAARSAAPPARQPQVRYGGCLAPHRHLRAAILPTPRQHGREAPADRSPSPHWTWARLLKRVVALDMARCPVCQQGRLRIIAALTAGNVIQKMLRHLKLAVDPPSIAPARHAAFAWDCSSPSRALRADVRPRQSVFLRWVPRLSVSVHTVIRVQLPRPLAAADDLPAPHPFATTLHRPTT